MDAHFQLDPDGEVVPLLTETTGWLMKETLEHITVAGEKFEDGTVRAVTSIPKGCVRSIAHK